MPLTPALSQALQRRLLHPPFLVDLTRSVDRVFFCAAAMCRSRVYGEASLQQVQSTAMSIKRISSRDNPDFRHLTALANDSRTRRATAETLLDGAHLVEEALAANLSLGLVAVTETSLPSWTGRVAGAPLVVCPEALLRQISPVATPSGVVASLHLPMPGAPFPAGDVLLLEDIQDPGNMGALLRTAAAAGVRQVLLSRGCTEAWSPKALRGGQGAQFRLQIREGADLVTEAAQLAIPVYAAVLEAAQSLYDLSLAQPAAFAFGNEGAGLSADLRAVTTGFRIPMPGGTESLNVGAACAITLFERVRQRQTLE